MEYLNWLMHFNPNHDPRNGQFSTSKYSQYHTDRKNARRDAKESKKQLSTLHGVEHRTALKETHAKERLQREYENDTKHALRNAIIVGAAAGVGVMFLTRAMNQKSGNWDVIEAVRSSGHLNSAPGLAIRGRTGVGKIIASSRMSNVKRLAISGAATLPAALGAYGATRMSQISRYAGKDSYAEKAEKSYRYKKSSQYQMEQIDNAYRRGRRIALAGAIGTLAYAKLKKW